MRRKIFAVFVMIGMIISSINIPLTVHATDYSASRIVDYVNSRLGESYDYGYCLKFVEECYENVYGFRRRYPCAYESGTAYIDSTSRDNIPLGATVYFGGSSVICSSCGHNAGHVAIYVGDGYIVHNWAGKIQKTTIDYIVSRSYPYRGYGWMCDVPLTTDTTPPSNPKISLSSKNIGVGEKLTITYSANNATNYRIGYVVEGGSLQVVEKGTSTSASLTFSKAGKYVIHVQCTNAYGSVDTEYISFNVYGSAPTNPTISLSTTFLAAAQTLTVNYSAVNATNYRIGYVVDGGALQVIEKGTSTSANLKFDKAGNYVIHVQCINACGSVDTKYIGFLVYDSAPKNCKITVPKTTVKVGESLPLNITADYADRYGFNIYRDDVRVRHTHTIYESDNKNYPITFSEVGVYKIYGLSYNYYNYGESAPIYITVEPSSTHPSTSTTATRSNGRIEIQTNISNLSQSAQCVMAVYSSDGALLGQAVNDANSSTNSITAYFPNYSNAAYVKVFLWDSLKGMRPLTNGEKVNL